MLTGKAKSDFIEYHYNQVDFTKESHEENYEMFLHQTEVTHQLASIIEWFDSVGIYIGVSFHTRKIFCSWIGHGDNICFTTYRQQATEQAIIKANEIYNSQ